MWPDYSLCKELRRGQFGNAWREKETHEGLATKATFSSNCDFRETWVGSNLEGHCWGLSLPQKVLRGRHSSLSGLTAPLWVHLFSRHCRKADTENTQSISEHQVEPMPHMLPRRGNKGQRERKYMPEGHMFTGGNQELQDKDTGWPQPYDLSSSSSSSSSSLLSPPFFLLPSHLPPPPPSLSLPYPSSSTCSPFLFLCRCKCGHLETRGQSQVPFL